MKKKFLLIIIISILAAAGLFRFKQLKSKIKGIRTENVKQTVRGIILPHHDFAREILINSYQRVDSESYQLIVLIGPNHFYPDIKEIITADSQTEMKISENLVEKITKEINSVEIDNQLVENEHSIGIQKKYINEYLPNAKVLPLVVPPSPYQDDFQTLINKLSNSSSNTLFMASVDFAHDLTYIEALENNKEAIKAISNFDYETINAFDDKHCDSPRAISLLMKIMQKLNAVNFHVLYDTHGAILVDNPNLPGTSYVVGTFSQPAR